MAKEQWNRLIGDDYLNWEIELVPDTEHKSPTGWLTVTDGGGPMPSAVFEVALWGKYLRLQKENARLNGLLDETTQYIKKGEVNV